MTDLSRYDGARPEPPYVLAGEDLDELRGERDAALARVAELETLAVDLVAHLDYCGWGDSWERECSEELRVRSEAITNEAIQRT